MTKDIDIRYIDVDDTLTLRKMVLRPDLDLAKARAPYAGTEPSFHIGVFAKEELVSIASFIERTNGHWNEENQWMLRGMATHPKYRNQGLGSMALDFGLRQLQAYKPRFVWCSARVQAFPFYQRLGFKPVGPVVNHANSGPHQILWRRFVPVYAV